MVEPDLAIALQLDLVHENAFDRFRHALPEDTRKMVDDIVRRRDELMQAMSRFLVADRDEALCYAEYIRQNVQRVAYEWPSVRAAFQKWTMRDLPPLVLKVDR